MTVWLGNRHELRTFPEGEFDYVMSHASQRMSVCFYANDQFRELVNKCYIG